jgi:crotonobetainyl-CoA:carnitine CoA-transferase CaiB-like acyl-CoA transferase
VDALRDPLFKGQPGRLANQVFIEEVLNSVFSTRDTAYWVEQLERVRVPCAPVNKFSDALSDPQVLHRKMVVDIPHPQGGSVKAPGNPIKMSVDNEDSFTAPPLLGQHTLEVLRTLGYSDERIEELKTNSVIGG